MTANTHNRILNLLDTWLTFEALNPQPLQQDGGNSAFGRDVVRLHSDVQLPWKSQLSKRREKEKGIYWIIYLTPIDLDRAFRSILKLFPDDQADERPAYKGEAAAAALVLDELGRPVPGSVFLASFGWSYGKLRQNKITELPAFPEHEAPILRGISERITHYDEEQKLLAVEHSDLTSVSSWLVTTLNLPQEEVDLSPFCVRCPQYRENNEVPEPELLNSFYIEDLLVVRREAGKSLLNKSLSQYLCVSKPQKEYDILKDQALLKATVEPLRLPLCRWPAPGRHPLFLMQQAAVNHTVAELATDGIVAVNGPPGTGKTTLLRDIIAHVIFSRAKVLARFERPCDAFKEETSIKTGKAYLLDEDLFGHEIIVSSSNNKAVENITKELPSIKAFAQDFAEPLTYFPSVSEAIIRSSSRDTDDKTWGLIAAVLGSSENRSRFFKTFWWDKDRGIESYLKAAAGQSPRIKDEQTGEMRIPEVVTRELPPIGIVAAQREWHRARTVFASAKEKVEQLVGHIEKVQQAICGLSVLKKREQALEIELRNQFSQREHAIRLVDDVETRLAQNKLEDARLREDRDAWDRLKPGFFACLFNLKSFREWRQRALQLSISVDEARGRLEVIQVELDRARNAAIQLTKAGQERACRHTECQRQIQSITALINNGCHSLESNLADDDFWAQPSEMLQKSSPWIWPELQQARDELFLASIRLHRAFIDAAADRVMANLRHSVDLFSGKALSSEEEPYRRSIFATFFLVVPVASTTFASFSRLLKHIKKAEVGWLLVDEAGQAVPQHAVGALHRSKRAVIIGDPMQIEPVVSLPPRLVNTICRFFNVSADRWAAPAASAQSLADLASVTGTTLHSAGGQRRIGVPLRVHRRCEEPMFSISNGIAYEGLMVYGTPPGDSAIGARLGPSSWFHVEGESQGKWTPVEGELLLVLLQNLIFSEPAYLDLYIISPFRQVASKVRDTIRKSPLGQHLSREWLMNNVGTVHTFQGKESDAVILLLGASDSRSAGARRWAGEMPNLVNVAVTRAKRRLYVIGNYVAWSGHGYFRNVAESLTRTDCNSEEWSLRPAI